MNRRTFLTTTGIFGAGILSGATLATKKGEFKYVAGFPTLPKDLTLTNATGICVDPKGHIYVAAGEKNPILVFNKRGKYITSWGEGIISGKHECRYYYGHIWVADAGGHQILKFTPKGKLVQSFGVKGEPGTDERHFKKPTDMAIAPNGDIYITDGYGNRRIVVLDANGKFKKTWGKEGAEPGEFKNPHNIMISKDQRIFIADRENHRIQVFNMQGKFLEMWTNFKRPCGIILTPDQKLFVTDVPDNGPHKIHLVDLKGHIQYSFGQKGDKPGQWLMPHSLCVDSKGDLLVAESPGKRFQKFTKK